MLPLVDWLNRGMSVGLVMLPVDDSLVLTMEIIVDVLTSDTWCHALVNCGIGLSITAQNLPGSCLGLSTLSVGTANVLV